MNFNEMGKTELRAACKAAGIKYGKLTLDQMRAALAALQPSAPELKPIKRTKAKDVKTTVQREQRFGVKRPNPGGKCAAVWEALDDMVAKGLTPDVAAIREWAAKHKQNANNAQIEFYGWRRWNGLGSKDKKAA
jgi:hypothetical protein